MRAALLAVLLLAASLAGCASRSEGERLDTGRIVAGATLAPPSPGWASPEAAKIRPGVMLHTESANCPVSFVFVRPDNTSVFVATTAYCTRDLHVGSLATVGTNDTLAVLIYSSFLTMAEIHESDPDALNYNDLAVFRIDDGSRKWVSPSMLRYGGPTGLAQFGAIGVGQRVRAFAALPEGAPEPLHERQGVVVARAGEWAYLVYGTPVVPGQIGAGVTTPEGKAVGVVVSLGVAPNPGANGVARLDTLMAYAKAHAKLDMTLVGAPLADAGVLASTASP